MSSEQLPKTSHHTNPPSPSSSGRHRTLLQPFINISASSQEACSQGSFQDRCRTKGCGTRTWKRGSASGAAPSPFTCWEFDFKPGYFRPKHPRLQIQGPASRLGAARSHKALSSFDTVLGREILFPLAVDVTHHEITHGPFAVKPRCRAPCKAELRSSL